MRMKSFIAAVLVLMLLCAGYFTRSHWWLRVVGARVTLDGQMSPDATVYRGPKGELAVFILENDRKNVGRDQTYVVFSSSNLIGVADANAFYRLGPVALKPRNGDYVMQMPSVMIEVPDPKLVISPNRVEFNSWQGSRVVAVW